MLISQKPDSLGPVYTVFDSLYTESLGIYKEITSVFHSIHDIFKTMTFTTATKLNYIEINLTKDVQDM